MTNRNPIEPIIDEPTPTQKIWRDVSSLQQKHTDALMKLYNAVLNGDHDGAVKANNEINAIEQMQATAHAAARRHAVKKAYNKVVNQRASVAR